MGLEIPIGWLTLLMFGSLLLLLMAGLPLAFVTGGLACVFLFLTGDGFQILNIVPSRIFPQMTNYQLSAIPLFIFMAAILERAGIIQDMFDVIYKLLEDIQLAMEGLLEPELVEESLGEAEVRAVFTIGKSAVAGCYVTTGKLQRNCKVRVRRGKEIVFAGDLDSLRRNKDDVKDVATGFECGIGCDRFANWKDGDVVEGYKLVTQRRKLATYCRPATSRFYGSSWWRLEPSHWSYRCFG